MSLCKDTKLKEMNERPGKERKKEHKTKAKREKEEMKNVYMPYFSLPPRCR
jgi:hypothetical protein